MLKQLFVNNRFVAEMLLAVLLFSGNAVSAAEAPSTQPILIVTEDWPPLHYSEEGQIKGFATEVVRLIMNELKVSYNITVLPGNRGQNVLNKGPRVMFYSFIKTADRENQYKWIGPFGDVAIYFFKRNGSPLQINSLEDAKKVSSVCSRDAGLVYNILKKEGFKNLDVGVDAASIYLKAIHGRCDLAIGEPEGGIGYWLKKSNVSPDLLERTALKVSDTPLYIAASKDIPDDEILRWQKALDKVKSSSEYEKLSRSYRMPLKK